MNNVPLHKEQQTDRAAITWLAVMGAATTLGSEPMVGMQWVRRLRARGPVSVLCSRVFRDPQFLPPGEWRDFIFVDTREASPEDYAANFPTHLWRWWLGVRAHLKAHARPGDRLFITAPAAIWMLPWVGGLPIPRERIFFGPMGADWVPRAIRGSAWPGARNLRTAAGVALWRLLGPWLPRDLALRAPVEGLAEALGPRFRLLGAIPEIEPPHLALSATGVAPSAVVVLFDRRPRKRFDASFGYALVLARAIQLPLMVVDAPPDLQPTLADRAKAGGVALRFQERLDRAVFQALLKELAPHFVSLSTSEGIPSSLIEVLLAGGRIHVHEVGGLVWLLAPGVDRERHDWKGAPVESVRWDGSSLRKFEAEARDGFARLLDAIAQCDAEICP
jgi:hypothetical protein